MFYLILGTLWVIILAMGIVAWEVRRRHMTRWIGAYVRQWPRRRPVAPDQVIHVILCIADHFEPKAQGADVRQGQRRVNQWVEDYPRQFGRFKDSDGRPPRYTFFFPEEEYEPEYLDGLAELCRAGFGEVEIHLHHQNDTAAGLRQKLLDFKHTLAHRHGLLGRDRETGEIVYGFIHGNWALCNSRPDGSWCGVNNELEILRETGCFVDMTFPSAPDPTQPPRINEIYYAKDIPGRPCSHDVGYPLGSSVPPESLLLIPGPLLLDWKKRKWGLVPRLENGCLQASQPPSIQRLEWWLRARVQPPTRPDWFFVKLHAHGAPEDAHDALLGEPMVRFHEDLARVARDNPCFHYHYVTAREMFNLAKAAEAGHQGTVAEALNYQVVSNIDQNAAQDALALWTR